MGGSLQFGGWFLMELTHQTLTQELVLEVWIDVTEKERHTN